MYQQLFNTKFLGTILMATNYYHADLSGYPDNTVQWKVFKAKDKSNKYTTVV